MFKSIWITELYNLLVVYGRLAKEVATGKLLAEEPSDLISIESKL